MRCVLWPDFEPDLKATTKQMMAKRDRNTKPGVNVPVACLTIPNTNGRPEPPAPPPRAPAWVRSSGKTPPVIVRARPGYQARARPSAQLRGAWLGVLADA